MTLHEYADLIGVTYQTSWNHFKAGRIKGAFKTPTGKVVVPDNILEVLQEQYEKEQSEKDGNV